MSIFALARGFVRLTQQRRGMHRGENSRCKFRRQYFAAFTRDAKTGTENRLRCRRAHGDHEFWLNNSQLRFQPRPAGRDLARIWFLMNPAFPARLPLKMLHCIRHINPRSINSSFLERLVHNFPSRTNERSSSDVLMISRLFANKHHRCALRAFPENCLRGALVKVTRLAIFRCLAHSRPTRRVWWPCRPRELFIHWRFTIRNRNSRAIRVQYFQCRLSKLIDSFCALFAKEMSMRWRNCSLIRISCASH